MKAIGYSLAVAFTALLMAFLAASSPAASRDAPSDRASAMRLREPDVEYEPTPQPVVYQMLELAGVGRGDVVYDLGSGDGRIPITAVAYYGAARGVGVDIDPVRIAEAEANALAANATDRVTFRNEDLLLTDIRKATVITLFLSRELNARLKSKLLSELRPGTRVVSYFHDMPGWQPQQTIDADEASIYLWIIPERR